MEYAPCCEDCVLNHDCLFQKNNDVESCEDYEQKQPKEKHEQNINNNSDGDGWCGVGGDE